MKKETIEMVKENLSTYILIAIMLVNIFCESYIIFNNPLKKLQKLNQKWADGYTWGYLQGRFEEGRKEMYSHNWEASYNRVNGLKKYDRDYFQSLDYKWIDTSK